MKLLSIPSLLLPLLTTLCLLTIPIIAQSGVCLPRSIIYGVPRTFLLYLSNYTALSTQPGWNNAVPDPAFTVTDETVNYLDGPGSGIPAHRPYAASKQDFIKKVKRGLQFPYREYVGEITWALSGPLEADKTDCDSITAGFTGTAQTVKVKGRYVCPWLCFCLCFEAELTFCVVPSLLARQ
jgi:hypothetical protein